jgi:hypothetical protein
LSKPNTRHHGSIRSPQIWPLIAYIAGTPASVGRFELLALAIICFLLALILHKIGSDILAGIRV